MSVLTVLFAWGTLIESEYGRHVAGFVLYGTPWFVAILGILALNILCSMILRFPWRRQHLPFLTAHTGILVLLAGSYLTWSLGEEAQMTLPEGMAGKFAVKTDRQRFELENIVLNKSGRESGKIESVPFTPGPFNWDDYSREGRSALEKQRYRDTLWWAMQWGHRDRGPLPFSSELSSARDVRVEVLDFYAGSTTQPTPPLELSVLWKKTMQTKTELGETKTIRRNWESVKLGIKPQYHPGRMEIRGTQAETIGGEKICYYMTTSTTEVEAFRNSRPNGEANVGSWGQLILYYDGKNHYVDVERLLKEAEGEKRFRLEGTDLEIGNVLFRPRGPILHFGVFAPNGDKEFLVLYPDRPEMNVHAQVFGIFGQFLLDPNSLSSAQSEQVAPQTLQRLAQPRIDLLQGPDKRLYYRYWNGSGYYSFGVVPEPKEMQTPGKKPSFVLDVDSTEEAEVVVERFVAQDLPGLRIVSLPVGRDRGSVQRVKLRATVDGKEDTFWLRAMYPTAIPLPPERDQVRYVHGQGRSVSIVWKNETIDLGFGIFLKRFDKRTEPGTRMSSHYSSLVDFVDMSALPRELSGVTRSQNDFTVLEKDVLIKMNRPAVFQGSKRRYRIYQSSYQGPIHPGDIRFQELYDGKIFPWEKTPRESIYMSTLSVNDDPGRGLKYLGSFLLVFGGGWFLYRQMFRARAA